VFRSTESHNAYADLAIQDKKDDVLVNIKSTALRFGSATRPILAGLTYVGQAMTLGPIYYAVSVLGTAVHLGWQLLKVDFEKRESCWKFFVSNGRLGGLIWSGMWGEYIVTWMGLY
jgi:4-hydroxybenzoate polyprenyltransferase